MSVAIIALLVFVAVYGGIATAAAWGLYKLNRGYEEEPELEGAALWRHSLWAGVVAAALASGMLVVGRAVLGIVSEESEQVARWGLLLIEWIAWGLFCIWWCELDSITQGMCYAVFWGLLKIGVQLLVFLPFDVSYWLR